MSSNKDTSAIFAGSARIDRCRMIMAFKGSLARHWSTLTRRRDDHPCHQYPHHKSRRNMKPNETQREYQEAL